MYPFRLFFEFITHKNYRALVILTFSIISLGTVVYHFIEGWRWLDSLYFSVITLATVGYGDFSPQTDFGKIFTIFYILIGIGIIFGFVNAFYVHGTSKVEALKEKRQKAIKEIKRRKK